MTIHVWGITDIGNVRKENQDAFLVEELVPEGYTLCVVCDGMGGPAGGRLASQIGSETCMHTLSARLRELSPEAARNPNEWVVISSDATAAANRAIREAALQNPACSNMGTTLVSAVARGENAVIASVGDSRAYHISRDGISRVTHDHSLVQTMVDRGEITPEEARYHPQRNLITRALGPDETVSCDVFSRHMDAGTYLLLCTDGLTNMVTDEELYSAVMCGGEPEAGLRQLLNLSKSRGAPDNVTAVLMQWA